MICTENTIYVQLYCMVHYFKARMNALNSAEHCEIRHIIILASLENMANDLIRIPNLANFVIQNLHFMFCCNISKYNRG